MIDPRVLDKMMPYMKNNFGNASSSEHVYGWKSNEAVDDAREQVSDLLNCSPNEIYFTAGATESNNIAIMGTVNFLNSNIHAITAKTEHKSVLDIFKYLSKNGVDITYLDAKSDGTIDLDAIRDAIGPNTKLVSIMMANNEIGIIHPIEEISKLCRENDIILHVDAAQAVGKINLDLKKLHIDLMSISAHKLYGPKGVGALYINRKTMGKKVKPISFGGGHESGLRPGTLAVHNIVGFGESCSIAKNEMKQNSIVIKSLTDLMLKKLNEGFSDVIVNGDMESRIPGNLNISFPGLKPDPLIQKLKNVAVSSGSACTTSNPEPSHVLKALGISKSLIKSTIRIGIGKFNSKDEIENAASYILKVVNKLKIKTRQ